MRFYVCPVCGNILTGTGDASLSCCGRKLRPLVPVTCGGEHLAVIEKDETEQSYYITLTHEMTKDHYLSFAACVYDDRFVMIRLYPEQDAQFRMPILKQRGTLYLYCTRHGLQKCRLQFS